MMSREQIKAARAMLNLSQKQLASAAGVSVATLNNIERGVQTDSKLSTVKAIRDALEAGGIEFSNASEGLSVVLKPKKNRTTEATILIIDDSREDRALYKNWLGKAQRKFRIIETDTVRGGYASFLEYHPDCIVLDFKMHGTDGFQFLDRMKKGHVRVPPVVFATALHNEVLRENAEKQGVRAYLNKNSVTQQEFHEAIERALA